jgi:hypothetical protein
MAQTRNQTDSLKERAKRLLYGVAGIGGIGIAWDRSGHEIVEVDIDPSTDKGAIERRLAVLGDDVRVRTVRGTLRAG